MRKQFKSIVAAILAVLMLMSISISAMAAEQVPVVINEFETSQSSNESATLATEIEVNQFVHNSIYLTPGRAGSFLFKIEGNCTTVQHKLIGNSPATRGKAVVFKIRNISTGSTRSFTAVSNYSQNNGWLYDTYNTAIPEGTYEMWIEYTGADGSYDVKIYFY